MPGRAKKPWRRMRRTGALPKKSAMGFGVNVAGSRKSSGSGKQRDAGFIQDCWNYLSQMKAVVLFEFAPSAKSLLEIYISSC